MSLRAKGYDTPSKNTPQVLKAFDLDGVAKGVAKEHGPLLSCLSLKTAMGVDDEFDVLVL